MKTRKVLKKNVQNTLIAVNVIIGLSTITMNDFELTALPILLGMWLVFFLNVQILNRYGRAYEKKYD